MRFYYKTILSLLAICISVVFAMPVLAECNFSVNLKTTPISTLMKGSSYTYEYYIKNTNTASSSISFSFSNKVNVTSITPSSFSLGKGYTKTVKVLFKMPLTVATNSNVTFSFKVNTNCSASQTVSFTVKAISSCSFTFTKNSTPSTITTLIKGNSYTYHYVLKNTSNDTATFSGVNISNITSFENLPVTLGHAAVKTVKVTFTMPSNATTNTLVTFSFKIVTSCNTFQTITFKVKAVLPCCSYTVTKNSSPPSKSSMNVGSSYTYYYTIRNTCSTSSNSPITFTLTGIHHIDSMIPDTFTLNPGQYKTVLVKFTMPNTTPGTTVVFSFQVKPSCSGISKTITFNVKAK